MKVKATFTSYASGNYCFSEEFDTIREAVSRFRAYVNDGVDGLYLDGHDDNGPDATMLLYSAETDEPGRSPDYPIAAYRVGRRTRGEYPIVRESV